MFDFLYFDLSKFYSWEFFLEGSWLASFISWIWQSAMIDSTKWLWSLYTNTHGHEGILWWLWAFTVLCAVLFAIIVLWTYGLACLLVIWFACWFIWYFAWKFMICLLGAALWNIVAWCLVHVIWILLVALYYLGPGFATGYIFQNITGNHWARRMFATSLWGLASIALFHFSGTIGIGLSVWHYCTSLVFYYTYDFDKNWFRKLSPTS